MNDPTPDTGHDLPDFGPHYLRNAMTGSCPAAQDRSVYPISDRTTVPGYKASRWNRLGYGENLDAILPCRQDACKMCAYCSVVRDDGRWPLWYGDPCPDERLFFDTYVSSFIRGWGSAAGLDEQEARAVGEKMALLELRRARLSMRMREMWNLGAMHDDGSMNPEFLHEIAICGRYMTRMDRQLDAMRRQLFGPVWDDDRS